MSKDYPDPEWGQLTELSRDECLELLRSKRVGRVAWNGFRGPQVMPVNYALDGESVLFRTSPNSEIVKALYQEQAAFEVDDIDEVLHSGWSVLLVGPTTYLSDPKDVSSVQDVPQPWVSEDRVMYIRIDPEQISGRRVVE